MQRIGLVAIPAAALGLALFAMSRPRSAALPMAVALLLLGVFTVAVGVLTRRVQKGTRINNVGVALMTQARMLAALEQFERARPYMRRVPLVHYNIGVANLCLWRVAEAKRAFAEGLKRRRGLVQLIAPHQALALAVEGNIADTDKALERARPAKNDTSAHAYLARADRVPRGSAMSFGMVRILQR